MPRPIDAVIAAHNRSRNKIEVPEWGLDLYFGPLTTSDMIVAEERAGEPQDGEGKPVDSPSHRRQKQLMLLVQKAELEDGTRAFEFGDIEYLKSRADFLVVQRLIAAMYGGALRSVEEGKAPSETTQTSDTE